MLVILVKACSGSRSDQSRVRLGARRGDVAMTLTHDPAEESVFVAEGRAERCVARARGACILSEPATLLMLQPQLDLQVLFEGDPRLINRYAVMRWRADHDEAADSFFVWLSGPAGRTVVNGYGKSRFGRPL